MNWHDAWQVRYVNYHSDQYINDKIVLRIYPVRDELPGPETWLIIRENETDNKLKYQFCNATKQTPFARLAEMSHSRYWIERAIQDAKGEAGLDEYQVG